MPLPWRRRRRRDNPSVVAVKITHVVDLDTVQVAAAAATPRPARANAVANGTARAEATPAPTSTPTAAPPTRPSPAAARPPPGESAKPAPSLAPSPSAPALANQSSDKPTSKNPASTGAIAKSALPHSASAPRISTGASLSDFDCGRTLGTGNFGVVILAQHKKSKKHYAIKIQDKHSAVKNRQVQHVVDEKRILASVSFPFLVRLECSFMDNANIFLVLEFVPGGELFDHLRKRGKFSEPRARFYAAQVVLALEYLHETLVVIYRDLKPENILLDSQGYIRITDFGFAKKVPSRTYTLVGTPDYMAPEIIRNLGYNKAVDWWALGVLIFEMACGRAPFTASQQMKTYENIVSGRVTFPGHLSGDAQHLVRCLLQVDVTKRFGNMVRGAKDVRAHRFFHAVDWDALLRKQTPAPFVPDVKSAGDATQFQAYPDMVLRKAEQPLYEREFKDF